MAQSARGIIADRLYDTELTDISDVLGQTGGTDRKTGDIEGVGSLRVEGDKWYRWVKNAETSDMVAGQPVCYDPYGTTAGGGEATHEEVIQPTTEGLNMFAGILIGGIPALGFGWMQIEGYNASIQMSIGKTSIAVGINAFPANTVSYVVGGAQQSISVVSTANQNVGRIQLVASIESSASSAGGSSAGTTAAGGFIHCLFV